MVFGYNVKEEATEIKDNLKTKRGDIITLVVAGVIGGIITRFVIPKRVTEASIFDKLKSWFEGDEEYE